jgi:tight adherence protein B
VVSAGAAVALLVVALAAALRWAAAAARRAPAGRRLAELACAGPRRGRRTGPASGRRGAPAPFRRRVAAALPEADPDRVWWVVVGLAGVSAVGGALAGGPGLAAAGVAGVVGATGTAAHLARHRGDAAYEAVLPAALDALARALRSGASLVQAVGEAAGAVGGPVGADLDRVARDAASGIPLLEALEAWPARRPLPAVRLAAAALCTGAELGGAQAPAVESIAATVRERLAVAGELRALSTQARASAAVLVATPLAFAALAAATDARAAAFWGTPLGAAVALVGLALDAAGALWMGAIVRGAGR